VIRTSVDPASLIASARHAAQSAWPGVLFTSMRPLDHYAGAPLARPRLAAGLFIGFGLATLLLATIGLYGLVTGQVLERTRDIGIRMALGSSKAAVLRSVLAEGAAITVVGSSAGATVALLLSHWLGTILYGVSHDDPATYVAAAVFICTITIVTTWIGARRAANVDPNVALRE